MLFYLSFANQRMASYILLRQRLLDPPSNCECYICIFEAVIAIMREMEIYVYCLNTYMDIYVCLLRNIVRELCTRLIP